eukprot:335279_1
MCGCLSLAGRLAGRPALGGQGRRTALTLTLAVQALVLSGVLLGLLVRLLLGGLEGTLALQASGGDQPLDVGALGHGLALLAGEGALNDKLAHVVLLGQAEQLADVGGTLGPQAAGAGGLLVGQARDVVGALLGNHQVQDGQVGAHDAPTHRLALALTLGTGAVVGGTLGHQQTHTVVHQHTLGHG